MAELSHLPFPYRLGVDVEQDTPEELAGSAAVIACTPRGHRDDDPSFGVTTPVFEQGLIDTERLAGELAHSDDRLGVDAEELLDLANTAIRIVRIAAA